MTQHNPFAFGDLEAAVATTESQREVWLAAQFGDDANCGFNESININLGGDLNLAALDAGLSDLVARHQSLRGCFSADGKEMVFYRQRPMPLVRHDLRGQVAEDASLRLALLRKQVVETPFDLYQGPLARFDLVVLSNRDHILIMSFHHAICDGWSLYVLAEELGQLYSAHCQGQGTDLPPAPCFADYVLWERSAETQALHQQSLAYWCKRYAQGAPSLELPYDNARPAHRGFAAERLDTPVDMALIGQLKKLAANNKCTLMSVLMAGFTAYLHRWSGATDIVLGVPFAGQMAMGEHGLVGHCVNIIPLYFQLSGQETFQDLIALAQQAMLEAYEYQYLTYGTLLQHIEASRDPTKPPLVSVIFNLDQQGPPSEAYTGLSALFGSNPRSFENFDLNLNITLSPTEAVMECTFNTGLWRRATLQRRVAELAQLYTQMQSDPALALRQAPLILPQDRQLIEQGWQLTQRPYPLQSSSLHGLIEAAVDRYDDRIALVFEDQQLSYRQLDEMANRLAHHLLAQGVGPEVLVPIMMERSFEMLIAINGILKAGGAYLPLDPEHPQDRIDYILEEAGAQWVITQARFSHRFPSSLAVIALDEAETLLAQQPSHRPLRPIDPAQMAYVIYTSGSTGKPKGVMNEHQAVCNNMLWMQELYQLSPADSVIQKTPYTFDVSVWELFLPLIAGSRLVIAKPGGHKEAAYIVDLINQHQVTHVHFVPSMAYLFLLEADQARCPSLVRVFASGEAVSKDLETRFCAAFPDVEFWNLYGPTEAAIHVTYWRCGQHDSGSSVPIGRALSNTRLYVVNEDLQLQPPGVPGELLLGGVQVARGYLNRPDLTAQRFIPDPFVADLPGRVYRTGDLVSLRDDGVVDYIGRNDFQVKVRGQRIELGEIEAVISQFPGVTQSVVMAREDRANDQRLVAYTLGTAPDFAQLREHLRKALPDYMLPQHLVCLDSFPLTSSGKVDRKALPAPNLGDIPQGETVQPENLVEEQLLQIWQDILGIPSLSVTADFFELGGHSLLGTQMFARVKQLFGVHLGLRRLFEAPSIRALAQIILAETQAGNLHSKILPRSPDEPAIASTQQQRVWYLEQIEPDSLAYNLPAAFRLKGRLNQPALARAFDTIEARHHLLRAGFATQGGKLLVNLRPSLGLDLTPVPVSALGAQDLDSLKPLLRARAASPFNTQEGPLFTAQLIALGEDDHVLFLLIHHLVFDGWSFDIFIKEICTLYNAYAQGLPNPLPALPVQYTDYAVWQKSWLASDAVQKQLDYWLAQLGGELPVLELPLDKPRPAHQAHRAEGINFYLDEPLLQALEDYGNRHGATLFMVILGLYALVLHRFSRQTDLLVSVPVSARNQVEISQLMGPFINRLVCRFAIKPQRSFSSWLQDVKKTLLDAMDNQDTQFETLVHALNPPRDAARPPLVQTLFSYQDVRNRADQMDGLVRTQVDIERMGVQTDLDVWVKRQVKGMEGGMEFPADLFHKSTVAAMGESLVALARGLVAKPEMNLGELASAQAAELELLNAWNQTHQTLPPFNQGLLGLWQHSQQAHAQSQAVRGWDGDYSYSALNQRIEQLAAGFAAQGVGPGQCLGVMLKRGRDLPAVLLALWHLGAAYIPLEPSHPQARIQQMLRSAGAFAVIGHAEFAQPYADLPYISLEQLPDAAPVPRAAVLAPDSLAYVIFTSGSTGNPKGVEISHGALANLLPALQQQPGIRPEDSLLAITTLAFDIAILELFLPLLSGASVRIAPEEHSQDGFALKALLDQEPISYLQATPATWRLLVNTGWHPKPGFIGLSGGEALPADLAQVLLDRGISLWNLYGPTEACVWSSCYKVDALTPGATAVALGRPLANVQLWVLDEKLQPLPVGAYGDLWIAGAGLALGYCKAPELTAERFITNAQGQRLYKTGDIARWNHAGQLEYAGRSDHQVKLRGFRIELEEIELHLRSHPAVAEAIAVVQEHSADQRLTAHLVYQGGAEPTASELRRHLRQFLPDYMLPQQFVAHSQLPQLASGKWDRKALAQPAQTASTPRGFVEATTETQKTLAAIWAKALKRDQVSIDSQFFDSGGHSLLALEVILAMEDATGQRFAPQDMWVNTLEQLAARIDEQGRGATPAESATGASAERLATTETQQTAHPSTASPEAPEDGGSKSGWLGRLFGKS
jgi:amino acid adenylation domain-containing protein